MSRNVSAGQKQTIEDHLRGIAGLVLEQHLELDLSDDERSRVVEFFVDCYSVTAENVLSALVEVSLGVILEDDEDGDDVDAADEDDDDEDDEDDESDDEDEDGDDEDDEDEDEDGEEEEDDGDSREAARPARR